MDDGCVSCRLIPIQICSERSVLGTLRWLSAMRKALEHLVYRGCVSNMVVMLYSRNDQHMSRNHTGGDLKVTHSVLKSNFIYLIEAQASQYTEDAFV